MYSTVPRPRRPRSNWLANSYALVGTAVTYKWALPLGGGLVWMPGFKIRPPKLAWISKFPASNRNRPTTINFFCIKN